ncbi:phosphonate metabolism protein/1,5-bisphosphokinase (PRPP-forming) PhnN [Leisingera aquaemixtae]|uniref:phosphonate metabolism protein/1,5-bisphosphokinase (PRPP-forming) PhnN n=1 Tax=Leisingera aquaemixtae TaxID=1396826 RepID=UPI0021A50268|nr:phosphonate metabolism protein/1,5-bisphosphokinase (PRPP-forming) PhnN [Leisingera aquaemixtae]UWQ25331.1 phosphonate metabolism protein/1,5-bisphosphokinase (PRPP-forming) PhnN [Leisingera aquaemixtae]
MSAPAEKGPVIAVVGPSGAGKDSLMSALAVSGPRLRLMRRVITRAPEAGGEDYQAVTEAEFAALERNGVFALHWQAHGLHYGIPRDIETLRAGAGGVLVNLSRAVLLQAQEVFGDFMVLSVTARPEVLAERLSARGREGAEEVQRRLARAASPLPEGLRRVHEIDNSGALSEAVGAALAALQPERA